MFNEELDWDAARKVYAEKGWVLLHDVFQPEFAEAIWKSLVSEITWDLVYSRVPKGKPNVKGPPEVITYTSAQVAALDASQSARIHKEINERAQQWFAFYYFGRGVKDVQNRTLREFYDIIGSEKYFEFIRYVSGDQTVNNRDANATCYQPGCFLKSHDDSSSENRRLAHVFGFTKNWQAHWGGLFHIQDREGHVCDTLIPGFNTLTLFKVPTVHYVSQVASYAQQKRYVISGWFTADD